MFHFLSPLTEPIGALWALMVLGMIWLVWRRHWRSAFWLGLPTLTLFIIGSTSLPERLVAREERQWADRGPVLQYPSRPVFRWDSEPVTGKPRMADRSTETLKHRSSTETPVPGPIVHGPMVNGPPFAAVVALGGGERVSQHDLLGFAEGDGGSRVLTAIELVRSGRAKTLVLGGSSDPMPGQPNVPSMKAVQDWVAYWGLASGHAVTNLGLCRNTHDEAVAFKKMAQSRGWTNAILVTSALHLRRGAALFRKQGIAVLPVAADFQVYGVPQESGFSPFPRVGRLQLLAIYMHEKIGWWVYRARGWV